MSQPALGKDLLGIQDLNPEQINYILETARSFNEISTRDIKKVPTLRGKTVINLFFEPSTRTRTSFEIAGKRLSADVINVSSSSSSTVKGETLKDTARNLQAMAPDIIVVRHSSSGVPHQLAKILSCSIINAGDGSHEHPTQALLDLMTVQDKKGSIEGLKVGIFGDIMHNRVAHSDILAFSKMGAQVVVGGTASMIPPYVERLGATVASSIEEVLKDADVIIMLRIQLERQSINFFPTTREYFRYFALTTERLKLAHPEVLVMHPGPMNRGVEIATEVADGLHSVILEQVTNGVAVRMALLYLMSGGRSEDDIA